MKQKAIVWRSEDTTATKTTHPSFRFFFSFLCVGAAFGEFFTTYFTLQFLVLSVKKEKVIYNETKIGVASFVCVEVNQIFKTQVK